MRTIKKVILKTTMTLLTILLCIILCATAFASSSWRVLYSEDYTGEDDQALAEDFISESIGSFSAQINSEALEMRSDNLISWRANSTAAINAPENTKGVSVVNKISKFTYTENAVDYTDKDGQTIAHHWSSTAGNSSAKFGNIEGFDALHTLTYWCTAASNERTNFYRFEVDKGLVSSDRNSYKVNLEVYVPESDYAPSKQYIIFNYKTKSGTDANVKLTPNDAAWRYDSWFTWTFEVSDIDLTAYAHKWNDSDYATFNVRVAEVGDGVFDSQIYIRGVSLINTDTEAPSFAEINNTVLLPTNTADNYGNTRLTFDMTLPENEPFTSNLEYNSGSNAMEVGIAGDEGIALAAIEIESTDDGQTIYAVSEDVDGEKTKSLLYSGTILDEKLTYTLTLDWRAKTYTVEMKNGNDYLITEMEPCRISNYSSVGETALGRYMKITHSLYSQRMMSVIDNIVFEVSDDSDYLDCKNDAQSIELSVEKIEDGFVLPLGGDNGTTFSWSSSNSAISVDNATGNATVNRQHEDTAVTLTVTVSKSGLSFAREIVVIVAEHPDSVAAKTDADAIVLDIPGNGRVNNNFMLPLIGSINNAQITWISNNAAIVVNGNLAQVLRGELEQSVVLTANVTVGTKTVSRDFEITVDSLVGVHAEITGVSETVTDNKLNATITVKYPMKEGNVSFVAVTTDETTGMVYDRQMDTKVINSANKYSSVEFTISNLSKPNGSTVSYFLWDDSDVSIKNNAPSPVKNLTSKGKVKGIDLSWDEAADDNNVLHYDIYRNGEYIGNSSTNEYFDKTAEVGEEHEYKVVPIDGNGLIGVGDTARGDEHAEMYYIDFSKRGAGDKNFLYGMEDTVERFATDPARQIYAYITSVTAGDGEDYSVATSDIRAIPFRTLTTAISSSDKDIVIEIEYLDTVGSFSVLYNSIIPEGESDSWKYATKTAASVRMTENTKEWKTAVVRLSDANLRGGAHCSNVHFMISCDGSPSNVFIRKFSVIQADLYD